ncbi:MAG: hypothetical protein J6U70_00225, partial [Bacteroidales bacterium]|nr:hypothetical protein [Bacteroidales bacterium]
EVYEGTTVIKNANFTRAGVCAEGDANVVFENGVINHKPERTSRYIFCALGNSIITVEDGTFQNDNARNSYIWVDGNAKVYVKGGTFKGTSNTKINSSNGGQVIITGGTFNFDPTAWLAAGYKAVKSSSTWTVVEE